MTKLGQMVTGGMRIGRGNDAEGPSSQVGASHIVEPTHYQYQHHHEAYQPQYEQSQYEQTHQQEGEILRKWMFGQLLVRIMCFKLMVDLSGQMRNFTCLIFMHLVSLAENRNYGYHCQQDCSC